MGRRERVAARSAVGGLGASRIDGFELASGSATSARRACRPGAQVDGTTSQTEGARFPAAGSQWPLGPAAGRGEPVRSTARPRVEVRRARLLEGSRSGARRTAASAQGPVSSFGTASKIVDHPIQGFPERAPTRPPRTALARPGTRAAREPIKVAAKQFHHFLGGASVPYFFRREQAAWRVGHGRAAPPTPSWSAPLWAYRARSTLHANRTPRPATASLFCTSPA